MVDFCLKGFSFSYPNEEKKALDNINLTINSGEFAVISGKSGSGKSTLLSMLKPEISPHGKKEGEILFFGKSRENFSQRESCEKIGYLLQNTEYQTVTHSVRTELAFGLENLGLASKAIRLRIAEISAYFSLEKIINKKIDELSGGQKQLVCLASILAMHPKAVIFDEPTSQLDPTAAQSFISAIKALCKDIGITVIITEHRLEGIIPEADRLIVLEDGRIIADCPPALLDIELLNQNEYIRSSMPFPMRLFAGLGFSERLPLTISEGRTRLGEMLKQAEKAEEAHENEGNKNFNIALKMKDVYFAYDKTGYVLKGLDLKVPEGSFYAVLGANSAGKSTALSLMCSVLPLKAGQIELFGRNLKKLSHEELYGNIICLLPQKCDSIFSCNSVLGELEKAISGKKLSKEEKTEKIRKMAELTKISHLLNKHPYDISGGEMQRLALAMVLLKETKIILMDEPTKGMDALFKKEFAEIIKELTGKGITVIMVSHDTEFCAENCDICAMISDGICVTESDARSFFSKNLFYTTAANRLIRGFSEKAVGEREVTEYCRKNITE